MDYMQVTDMLLHIDQSLGTLIGHYGTGIYLILFLLVFGQTGIVVLPFLPGNAMLFIAGAYAASGQLDVWLLGGVLMVGAIAGNLVNYGCGYWLGRRILASRRQWVRPEHVQRTTQFYARHGGKTIVIARVVPIVRTVAPFVAGMSAMPFTGFLLATVAGGVAWTGGLLALGYVSGQIPFVHDNLNVIVLAGMAVAVVPLLLLLAWRGWVLIRS